MDSFENYNGFLSKVLKLGKIDFSSLKFVDKDGNSPVNCEHPSFVLNKNWKRLLLESGYVNYVDGDILCRINLDSYTNFTDYELVNYFYSVLLPLVNSRNMNYFNFGGSDPLFYLFPCGHCSLCRARKSSEYSFRSACESYDYPKDILFVTLTYKDEFLPSDGVCVGHLQNFFKRLRFWLSKRGLPTNFRYLAVSEYGSKGGRPHYHMILWNFPVSYFERIEQAFGAIRFAWMTYRLDEFGKRKYVFSERFQKYFPVRTSFGYSCILPIQDGCSSYVTKYFRKESSNKLRYPNKTFLLSSRRNGGIGSAYIRRLYDFVVNNKAVSVSVLDPISNREFKYPISGYLKELLFPCPSSLYSKYKLYRNVSSIVDFYHEAKACFVFLKDMKSSCIAGLDFYQKKLKDIFPEFMVDYPHWWYRRNYSYLSKHDEKFLYEKYSMCVTLMDFHFSQIPISTALKLNELCRVRRDYIRFRQKNYSNRLYNIFSNINFESYKFSEYLKRCKF